MKHLCDTGVSERVRVASNYIKNIYYQAKPE